MIDPSLSLMLQCSMSVMVVPLQREFLTHLSFALGVDANAKPVVRFGTDDRPVTKFDATMFHVINGALQRTRLSFALGIDANARPVVRLVQMIDRSLSLMLQCCMSLMDRLD